MMIRCTNPKCQEPLECEVLETEPLGYCPACVQQLVRIDDNSSPETRFQPVDDKTETFLPPPPPEKPSTSRMPVNHANLPVGYIFADRYKILKKLGQGGMGSVYLAEDANFEAEVAIKIPDLQHGGGDLVKRFIREARAMRQLRNYANVVKVQDVVSPANGVPYMTMEYIQGKSLSEVLRNGGGRLPQAEAIRIVRLMAEALDKAHSHKIIHRDLKPANVMIREDGTPVLMDFGLARRDADERITQNNMVMGTLPYMSPEQAKGENDAMGPASDIYSLGVILYELLTGRKPFEGPEPIMLRRIIYDAPVSPAIYCPGLDRRLEEICLKSIAKQPVDRFASMAVMAEAITSLDLISQYGATDLKTQYGANKPQPPSPARKPDDSDAMYPHAFPPEPTIEVRPPRRRARSAVMALVGLGVLGGIAAFGLPRLMRKPDSGPGRQLAGLGEKPWDTPNQTPEPSVTVVKSGSAPTGSTELGTPPAPSPAVVEKHFDPKPPVVDVPVAPPKPAKVKSWSPRQWQLAAGKANFLMIPMAGGNFSMGDQNASAGTGPLVAVRHPVKLTPYYLSETEIPWSVVVAYWNQVPNARPAGKTPPANLDEPAHLATFQEWTGLLNWLSKQANCEPYYDDMGQPPGENDPRRFGDGLRLPTEAEMEFALAKSPDPQHRLPGLVGVSQADKDDAGFRGLRGNLRELCGDWFAPYDLAVINDPMGPREGDKKVTRGGQHTSTSADAKATHRSGKDASDLDHEIGARIATYVAPQ